MLLPDGRVISGGGNGNQVTQKDVEIFCPPYLFKSDGTLATRPGATGSPQRVRYGALFSLCLSTVDSIRSACLIRQAAVTHGFNENQRYVPLTKTQTWSPGRLIVTAPADSFEAPPGDYLLFAVDKHGVPSIARWLRLGFSWSEVPADQTAPDSIALVADIVTNNTVNLTWTATGDDHTTGTASYAELRYSSSPIVTSTNWDNATRVSSQPVPVCGGTGQAQLVTGLSHNHNYYFGIKTSDESGNVSAIGRLKVKTTDDCCEGEARAGLARDDDMPIGSRRTNGEPTTATTASRSAQPTGAVPTSSGTGLLLEAVTVAEGLDVRVIPIQGESYSGYPLSADGGVLVQSQDGSEEWTTQLHYDLPPGNRFALCTPEQTTRWVILAPCAVAQIVTAVHSKNAASTLDAATSSRAGDVRSLVDSGSPPSLEPGDTLSLHYAAGGDSAGAGSGWILVMERLHADPASSRAGRRPEPSVGLPKVFALHQNLPNPFAATTRIGFALPVTSRVRLDVYDLLGRRVRTLANGFYPPGEHEVEWDRRTPNGALASPGLYFYRMDAGQYRERRRMVILPR
jgi:hypothetical protein